MAIVNIDIFDIISVMNIKINVLALDGVFDTGLAIVQDTFSTANELAEMSALTSLRFDVAVVSVRRTVRTSHGLSVPVVAAAERTRPAWVVVPALGYKMPGPLQQALERPELKDARAALCEWSRRGAGVAAACVGTFVLAETGLLDGHAATTTWWLAPIFRQRYPRVLLDESRMVVKSEKLVTAGAALSHIDMALSLIREVSPELAALTAKYLVIDKRPSQSAYAISDQLIHSDPMVERFERWARDRLSQGFSLDDAARTLATSKRTLARRMREVLGKTPLSYFQDLRVEHAVHLLETTRDSIEQIATSVGYADGITLRALLRRRLGRGVRELRVGS
jgi:transcriptional regulator GlxA family with amidase domain